mmetsp:Transcript_26550/g.32138  ORF Transcript_26550/g.32138 Transcript_26550/m.32138 type:complete len:86 (-) Transcript_26550:252-509(-)
MSDISKTVEEKCSEKFQAEHCTCVDQSDGCGTKLELTVISEQFQGTPLLARHRKINSVIKENGLMDRIHALTIHAWTPAQWKSKS